jgi:hypothetical protein
MFFGTVLFGKRISHPFREVDIERSALVDVTDLVSG